MIVTKILSLFSGLTTNQVHSDRGSVALVTNTTPEEIPEPGTPLLPPLPATPIPPIAHAEPSTSENEAPQPSLHPGNRNPAGITIISRFPNSRNEQDAKGHYLADTVKRNSPNADLPNAETSPRLLHDFQTVHDRTRRRETAAAATTSTTSTSSLPAAQNNRTALNRLTDSTAVLNRGVPDSSSGQHHPPLMQRHYHNSPLYNAPPSLQQQQQQSGDIQCNEISSSDDDTPVKGRSSTLPTLPSKKGILKESRLSREVSALQLDTPGHVTRRHRKRSHSANTSDAENEDLDDVNNRSRRLRSASGGKTVSDVELKCRQLNAKFRSLERKVAEKTSQLNHEVRLLQSTLMKTAGSSHFLRSTTTPNLVATTPNRSPRSLRPRSGISTPVSCSSLRKRKLVSGSAISASESSVAKSPRRSLTIAMPISKKPIMTRSRKARVLQLKK